MVAPAAREDAVGTKHGLCGSRPEAAVTSHADGMSAYPIGVTEYVCLALPA